MRDPTGLVGSISLQHDAALTMDIDTGLDNVV
jgi:hypothetical protein